MKGGLFLISFLTKKKKKKVRNFITVNEGGNIVTQVTR